jgi:predicted kinase
MIGQIAPCGRPVLPATVSDLMATPVLYLFSGLPGSGKTTLARALARLTGAAYLRIDTIEQGLRDLCDVKVAGEGYRLSYRIAADNLELGTSVIADSCNPIELTRREWDQVARNAAATPLNIEVICSDKREHQLRVEARESTIAGLELPSWEEIIKREYHAWRGERLEVDTAGKSVSDCMRELLQGIDLATTA